MHNLKLYQMKEHLPVHRLMSAGMSACMHPSYPIP